MFDDYYMRKRKYMAWRGPIIAKAIDDVLHPSSVVDVGCSIGEFVAAFSKLGKTVLGIDNSESARKFFMGNPNQFAMADITGMDDFYSLSLFFTLSLSFDLCLCFELATVIEPQFFNCIANNISGLSNQILFSSIRPWIRDQWVELMEVRGYTIFPKEAEEIKKSLESIKRKMAIRAIYYGLTYFKRI